MIEPQRREIWVCLESLAENERGTAAKLVAEGSRISKLLNCICCGIGFGSENGDTINQLSRFGLEKLYVVAQPSPPTAETYAHTVAKLAATADPSLLIFAATAFGSEAAARTAATLGTGLVSSCIEIEIDDGRLVARKAVYDGEAHVRFAWCGRGPHVASLDLSSLEAIDEQASSAVTLVSVPPELFSDGARRVAVWKTEPEKLDLSEAHFVLGIGRPIISHPEALASIAEAARRLGAALGASRPVVEAGLLPKERQVGATGKWLSANVYLACGISGSSYHMLGVREVPNLIAINIDPNAPIHKQAKLSIVADLFEVLPALAQLMAGTLSDREVSAKPSTKHHNAQ